MIKDEVYFEYDITIEEYNALRESVDFILVREERAKRALNNSLYKVFLCHDGKKIGMARVVGDGGYVYFICDVIVHPAYQSKGLGRMIIENVLGWIKSQVTEEGDTIMVNLMSAMGKEEFYGKLGFNRRPFGNHGAGMSQWITKE